MFCDWFPFDDGPVFALGVLLSSIGAKLYIDYSTSDKKLPKIKHLIIICCIILAGGCYQPTMEFFVIQSFFMLSMLLVFDKSSDFRISKYIKNLITITAYYVFSALLQFVFIKYIALIYGTSTRIDHLSLLQNIKKVLDSIQIMLKNANGTIPKNIFPILINVLLILVIIQSLLQRGTINKILVIVFNLIITIGAVYSPYMISAVYTALRTCVLIMFLPCMLVIWNILLWIENRNSIFTFVRRGIRLIGVIIFSLLVYMLGIYIIRINFISTDMIKVNYLDRMNTIQFMEEIECYEANSGEKISSLGFPKDEDGFNAWYPLFTSFDTNVSGFVKEWSRCNMFTYYSGRQFTEVSVSSEEWNRIKKNNNEKSNIYFEGGVAYIPLK